MSKYKKNTERLEILKNILKGQSADCPFFAAQFFSAAVIAFVPTVTVFCRKLSCIRLTC